MNKESNKSFPLKKIILIMAVIFILGPLVFVGACLPIGFYGSMLSFSESPIVRYLIVISGVILGLFIAVFVCYILIKKINRK